MYSHQRYRAACDYDRLPDITYKVALALRLNVVPRSVCSTFHARYCPRHDKTLLTMAEVINHAMRCDSLSGISAATRHNHIKYAMRNVACRYGVEVAVEPTGYVYFENASSTRPADVQRRPDIRFKAPLDNKYYVTDLTIVAPDDIPGAAALRAAENKRHIHSEAVHARNHIFIPFAAETSGFFADCCDKLVSCIAEGLPEHQHHAFKRDFASACAAGIAQFRAEAVMNVFARNTIVTTRYTDM